jgi:hypothetical protein
MESFRLLPSNVISAFFITSFNLECASVSTSGVSRKATSVRYPCALVNVIEQRLANYADCVGSKPF